jgi:hypothetical protein
MFEGILVDESSAKVFRAGDAKGLASALRGLMDDPQLYELLSRNSEASWQGLQISTQWGDLVRSWLGPGHPRRAAEDGVLAALPTGY